ncbi:cation transport regulator [Paraburkholderia sp. JPY465]|uniref:ChaB family protein n=1 Tax=Paraburkholderia sp. JPY465 TaxID=3042285 RepID=UPI003D24D053
MLTPSEAAAPHATHTPILRAENEVPYSSNADLPESVRDHLPQHAQELYRAAFNAAYEEYAADARHEEIAHRVAWAAVKRRYVKDGTESG